MRGKEGNLIKIRKSNPEVSDVNPKFGGGNTADGGGNTADGYETVSPVDPHASLGRQSIEESPAVVDSANKFPAIKGQKVYLRKNVEGRSEAINGGNNESNHAPSVSHSMLRDSKPLLKLKFKNPYHENQSSWAPLGEDEKSSVKGQRSKRKRPSPFLGKTSTREDEDVSQQHGDDTMDEIMDANWILQKLGKDAIGKRVEVHQPSDNSW